MPKEEIDLEKAHRLLNAGPLVLVTAQARGRFNIHASPWAAPLSLRPALVGVAIPPARLTHDLIKRSGEFVLNIPGGGLEKQVKQIGAVSGHDVDKLKATGLSLATPKMVGVPLLGECLGHLECGLQEALDLGDHTLFVGEVLAVWVERGVFDEAWRLEEREGKPLHFLGGGYYAVLESRAPVDQTEIKEEDRGASRRQAVSQIVDLTVPISVGMTTFPGDPAVGLDGELAIAKGDLANVSRYCFGSHAGTHVDPPCHFIPGAPAVDELPLEDMVGPAQVLDLGAVPAEIGAGDLAGAGLLSGITRVLLKTRNSRLWDDPEHRFQSDYVALGVEGARWLVERGVRLVGIDYLSIEALHAPGHPVHHTLLSAGVIIVEGLDLRFAAPGERRLVVLPLKVKGGDGGPARAVLA